MMKRSKWLIFLSALFLASLVLHGRTAPLSAQSSKPNIIVIITDDQDRDSVAIMRKLMANPYGKWFQFTDAMASDSIGGVARVSLLTGQYTHNHKIVSNKNAQKMDDRNTLATWLQESGYYTALIGKYLNGYPWTKRWRSIPRGWNHFSHLGHKDVDLYSNDTINLLTNVINTTEQPFFLYLAHRAPQRPAEPPPRYEDENVFAIVPPANTRPNFAEVDMSDKPKWASSQPMPKPGGYPGQMINGYPGYMWDTNWIIDEHERSLQQTMAIDDSIEVLLDFLDEKGELDNTIIFYTADSGYSWGAHRRTGRGCPFEECSGIPFLVFYPNALVPAGSEPYVVDRAVSNIDMTATIVELAGATPRRFPQDGTSLLPLLNSANPNTAPWADAILLENLRGPIYKGVRTQDWKYVEYPTGELELYDLVNDPYEMENVALNVAYRSIRNEMAAKLDALMGRTTSSISGRVANAAGVGIGGVVVSAGSGSSTVTASDGTYVLTGLQSGKKKLKLTKWGYKFTPGTLAITVPPNATERNFTAVPNQTYVVSGVIKKAGKPFAGVTVSNGQGRTAVTDARGRYSFGALPAGVYTITPSKAGSEFGPVSEVVEVPPGRAVLNFTGANAQTYDVGGIVRDENNIALPGVTITASNGRTVTTDNSGRYNMTGLASGNYTLTASKLGYVFAQTNSVTLPPSSGLVNFSGQTIYYSISGSITTGGTTPQPVEGVLVSEPGGKNALTNAQGQFTISGLRVGTYTLTATKQGYNFTPPTRSVTLSGSNSTGTTFSATQITYTISGRVVNTDTNNGEPGVQVSNGNGQTVTTNSTGNYTFTGLLPGSYTLTASKNSFNLSPASLPVTLGYQNSVNNNFTAGEITYQVSGTVVDSDGLPMSGVSVTNSLGRSAITTGDGRYTITLPLGTNTLTARKTGYGFQPPSEDVEVIDQDIAAGPDFVGTPARYSITGIVRDSNLAPLSGVTIAYGGTNSVTSGADGRYTITDLLPGTYVLMPYLQDYNFQPQAETVQLYYEDATNRNFIGTYQTYKVEGVVKDLTGAPIAGVTISAGPGRTATTNGSGVYSLGNLPRGTYTLTAQKTGYLMSTQLPVDVPPNVTDHNFVGELIVYSISGQVMNGDTPMAGVSINYATGKSVLTNGSGRFTISNIVPGNYTLTPSLNGYSFDPSSIDVDLQADVTDILFAGTQQRYTISGVAKTAAAVPLEGVVINYGPGLSVTTDATGAYTIPDLLNGTYLLTAYLDDHVFDPTPLSVSLNYQSKANQNFEGTLLTYSVSGTVRDSKGALMSGVKIDAGNGRSTTTNNSGTYKLDGLPRGTYNLVASKAGYTFDSLSAVTVPPDVTNHNFTGTLIVWDISGVVIDEYDNPLPNVKITYGLGTNDWVLTNGSGQFMIEDRLPGSYTLTPSRQGYQFEPTQETINLQSDVTDIRFDAEQIRYTITGLVRTSGLQPIPNVVIDYGEGRTVTTDASGRYTITDLLNGSYTLTPSLDEYTFNPQEIAVALNFANKTQNFTGTLKTYFISGTVKDALGNAMVGVDITATNGQTVKTTTGGKYTMSGLLKGTYTLTASRAGYSFTTLDPVSVGPDQIEKDFTGTLIVFDITGRILDQDNNPLSGVTITYVTGSTSRTVQTEADGTYRITAVPGTYTLTPSKQGYRFELPSRSVSLTADTPDVDFQAIQLKYTISGFVRTGSGAGIANVVIDYGEGRTVTTDANGAYTILDLVNGTYTLTPTLEEYTFSPSPVSVALNFANKTQNFTGTVVTYAVTGTVLDAVGPAMSGVTISAGPGLSKTTGTDGTYTLLLPKGTYTLTAARAGYRFTTRDPITVPPGVSAQDFTGTLIVYNISGRVVDQDNNSLPDVTITAVSGATSKSVQTGADGSFVITTVPGLYTLTASRQGYLFGSSQQADARLGDVSGLSFNGTRQKYQIRGTIQTATGTKTAGVVITYGEGLTTTTDLAGIYTIEVYPGDYTLTPALKEYTFDPPSRSVTLGFTNSSANNFTLLTYAVTGQVTDASNNSNMSLVEISAGPGFTARTNTNGIYTLLLPAGTYTLEATKAGYGFTAQTVTVPPAQTVNFTGERVTYTISGKIVNAAQQGVPGIPILYGNGRTAVTDLAGEYIITGLTPGTYTLKPQLTGLSFQPVKYDIPISTSSVSGYNFEASGASRTINGTIIGTQGQGLGNVAVWYGAAQPVFTNGFGQYSTPALLPGTYVLEPMLSGYSFTPVTATVPLTTVNITQNFVGE